MHSVESVKFKCSALYTVRDLGLPVSYNVIEESFVMETDSLFLEVVGTQLLQFLI